MIRAGFTKLAEMLVIPLQNTSSDSQRGPESGDAQQCFCYSVAEALVISNRKTVTLCVYNRETTPPNNLESRVEEQKRCQRTQVVL